MKRAALALCLVTACVGTDGAAPKPTAVAPTRGAAGAAVSLTVTGDAFYADVLTDFRRSSQSVLSGEFSVRLVSDTGAEVALGSVMLVDVHTLTAEVPATAPRGLYDVVVTDPSGRKGTLTGGFRVVTSAESVAAFQFDFIDPQRAGVPFAVGLTAVDEVGRSVEGFDGMVDVVAPGQGAVAFGPFALGRYRGFVTVPVPAMAVQLQAMDLLGHGGSSDAFDVTAGDAARVAFVEAPDRIGAGTCGGPFTLELQDTFGNAALGAGPFSVTVNPPEGVEVFLDATCAAPAASGMLSGRVQVFVRSTRAGRPQLRVVPEAWPSVVRDVDVDAGAATALAVVSAQQVLAAGMCSRPVDVQAQDPFGNPAPVAAPVPLEVVIEPSSGVTLHDEGTCATPLNTLEIAAGAATARFHFRSAVPAMLSLSVDGGALGVAVQAEEVTP